MRHPVDRTAAVILRLGPPSVRFFSDGWGDDELLDPPDLRTIPAEPLDIRWITESGDGNIRVAHGVFTSPVAQLPHRARLGSALRILPPEDPRRMVVLMPAWNEHEPHVRVALAHLLADRGIGSILLENAYFGTRRPDDTATHPIRTVSDFMVMGSSAVIEARAILAGLRSSHPEIGVSGYSMGGNTAALVAASVPFRVAVAALAASHSPAPVFLDGVLHNGVAWDALGGRDAADRLRSVLGAVSVLNLEPPPHVAAAVVVGARSDAYIPASATRRLAEHWRGSLLRFEPGGHASLVWLRKRRLADAIRLAFDRSAEAV
jgi:dienelactone hydrolase